MAIAVGASGRIAKMVILGVYYWFIEHFNLFQVRTTFLVVGLVISRLCLADKTVSMKERTAHLIGDTVTYLVVKKVLYVYAVGSWGAFFVLGLALWYVPVEYCKFKLLGGPGVYRVEIGNGIQDQLSVFFVMLPYYLAGLTCEVSLDVTFMDFVNFLVALLLFDLVFGLSHYVSHRNKTMWNMHKKHHQYRQDQLCSFANFYADIYDSLSMTSGAYFSALYIILVRGNFASFTELATIAFLTHNKYAPRILNLMVFCEVDFLDDILGHEKMCAFHQAHHNGAMDRFSLSGMLTDQHFRSCDWLWSKFVPLDISKQSQADVVS
uniref:Fatty acid hydroxylase domain-containing protein n=1 Tax=Noctiluca scintillans TaxID=2966 RepID=A0A7S1FDS9_NOCSC|mmetsp:Transcript_53013/g.141708  ORF Transcript_53013/g.141708 Transcript_53013/m.141708 type:complete len:322 (+) Transcript_53013:56-1021(+)